MRKNRLAIAILLVMVMLLGIMTTAFAADYTPVDPDDQGKTGIVGGDTLTFTEDTVWANLTARWGVRVIFQDGDEWNNAELKSELIPVTDSAAGSTTAPEDPSHDGWTFTGWERVDTNNGSSTLNDDGTVTGINGPGPIIYQAVYEPVPPKTGGLTVSKTISGDAADAAQAFTFTVTLSDTTVSGEFGDMAFEEGIATFTLKGGESVTAEGLPAGVSYIVAESDNDGYEVTKTGDTGEIADGETAAAAFTNTKNSTPPEEPDDPPAEPKTGSLTISKTVTGTEGDTEKAFTFTVTFGAEGSFEYTGSKSGTITSGGTVQLKHGESITISGIPADTSYMVAESDNEGYEVTKTGDTGTIAADTTATASFANKKDAEVTPPEDPDDPPAEPKTGSLTISKTVTGTAGEKDKLFTFTVTIGAEGTYNYTGSKSGTITSGGTVQLKHGESITISGIPEGTSYAVVESDNSGYEVTKTGDTGTIAADTTAKAAFTNKKDAAPITPPDKPGDPGTPKTGDDSNIALWISLLLASFIGMIACFVLFRKKRAGKHMRTFMMLLLVGVMAFSCFGATSAFAAEDGTTGYTYGQYDMTYLPGTTDTVTNMPANETGLTPGSDNPYTVSSTVPVREGFEFIDWTLTWGTMEKPETPVDYSDALTVSKKATAVAAGDANTARAYTITLEAKVNINADDPTGLFVENLTVTDTIEDEFALNGVTAEILDSTGSVVSSDPVSAAGPTVTHDFGNIEHGYTARLILGVTAQPDYIGSNGVYTNVGESGWTYKHTTDPEATEAEAYSVTCPDKPQVNVPIVFSVNPRGEDVTHHMGDLATFNGTNIPIPAHEAAQKYDQINGTFSYSWELHNGTQVRVQDTIHVTGGMPDVSENVLNGMSSISWRVPTNHPLGDFPEYLYVTFTPDAAEEGTFADETTAEPVTAKTKDGALTLTVVQRVPVIDIIDEDAVKYTVRYLEKEERTPVLPEFSDWKPVGTSITRTAPTVLGYSFSATDDEGNPQSETITIELIDGENVITFWYELNPNVTDYVVKYLDKANGGPVADEKHVYPRDIGSIVTEYAINVQGYKALAPTGVALTLAESGNVIVFYYEKLTYQVTYVVNPDPTYGAPEDSVTPTDENNPYEYMAQVTVKDNLTTAQTYATVDGKQVPGVWTFTPWDKEDFQITKDTTISGSWYFTPYTYYTVQYLDVDTNEPVAPEKVVGLDGEGNPDLPVGTSVTETAIPVDGYAALGFTVATRVLGESGNEFIFYYQKLTTYTIHYCDDLSGEDIAEPKTVPDVPVGETITEYAIEILGYVALDNEKTFTLMESGNDYYLYYIRWDVD